jgi:hypothetical protein
VKALLDATKPLLGELTTRNAALAASSPEDAAVAAALEQSNGALQKLRGAWSKDASERNCECG